jgi:hypothetical protein
LGDVLVAAGQAKEIMAKIQPRRIRISGSLGDVEKRR